MPSLGSVIARARQIGRCERHRAKQQTDAVADAGDATNAVSGSNNLCQQLSLGPRGCDLEACMASLGPLWDAVGLAPGAADILVGTNAILEATCLLLAALIQFVVIV